MKRRATAAACFGIVSALLGPVEAARAVQAAGQSSASANAAAPATRHRALLDQYCVTCHNDRLKTANLSLEKLDLADGRRSPGAVGESHPQAARRRDAAAGHAAAAAGRLRGAARLAGNGNRSQGGHAHQPGHRSSSIV